MPVELVWLKRDLRVRDHAPLCEASRRGPVAALYIYEPDLLTAPDFDRQHLTFLNECLADLERSLEAYGGFLIRRFGAAVETLDRLHEELGFARMWSHEETGNRLTYDRDLAVAAWARRRGVRWEEIPQTGVVRPLRTRDGWAAAWRKRMASPIVPAPEKISFADVSDRGREVGADDAGLAVSEKVRTQSGGESEALGLLDSFVEHRGCEYTSQMSSPVTAESACSRLSPHFAFGTISIRAVYQRTRSRSAELKEERKSGKDIGASWLTSLSSYGSRLRWHCHFMQKLEDEPGLEFRNLSRAYDGLRDEEPDALRFAAWKEGLTGYPMVDACMRYLRAGGWINFRMRAMLVSFAAYHLWLHWRAPGQFLAKQFLDFEPGIHWSQMQMQSGTTGINTNRIYSPIKQAADQDPTGVFIRRWVPELEPVPDEYLAEPHKLPPMLQAAAGIKIGKDYPAPIVDHAEAYRAARSRISSVKRRDTTREEAERVAAKHGSRKRPPARRRAS